MKAGFEKEAFSEKAITCIRTLFQDKGLDLNMNTFSAKVMNEILTSGEVDLVIAPLSATPVELPEGVVIAALTGIGNRGFCLVCRTDVMDNAQTLFLKKGIVIGASEAIVAAQLADYRPDAQISILQHTSQLVNAWVEKKLEAIVLPVFEYDNLKAQIGQHQLIPLHPREMIPSPGHGVVAYLTLTSNMNIRKFLKNIHQPEISALTNIERKVQKQLQLTSGALLGVFCESPRTGQYRVTSFLQLPENRQPVRASITSTTSFELADLVVAELKKQVL